MEDTSLSSSEGEWKYQFIYDSGTERLLVSHAHLVQPCGDKRVRLVFEHLFGFLLVIRSLGLGVSCMCFKLSILFLNGRLGMKKSRFIKYKYMNGRSGYFWVRILFCAVICARRSCYFFPSFLCC